MYKGTTRFGFGLCALALAAPVWGAPPKDVTASHWAAPAVEAALQNGILSLESGKFNGDDKVTRAEAVVTLAKLARALETGKWKARGSVPIPSKVVKTLEKGNWQAQPVTRYALAMTVSRLADYVTNGIQRAKPGEKDVNKSIVLPPKPEIALPKTDPAYESLRYLVDKRMLWPKSPLLKPDSGTLTGAQWSVALAQMVTGLTNQLTDLNKEADGSTKDRSFRNKRN